MLFAAAIFLILIPVLLTLGLRQKDRPETPPVSPTAHLEQRKAQIYENLRDLQFEYRVGKLSDSDYHQTKVGLQQQLATVLAAIEAVGLGPVGVPAAAKKAAPFKQAAAAAAAPHSSPLQATVFACPHCAAKFDKPMKFCGECGKAIA